MTKRELVNGLAALAAMTQGSSAIYHTAADKISDIKREFYPIYLQILQENQEILDEHGVSRSDQQQGDIPEEVREAQTELLSEDLASMVDPEYDIEPEEVLPDFEPVTFREMEKSDFNIDPDAIDALVQAGFLALEK